MSGYLKCEWCDRNASQTIRIPTGKLTGVCLQHLYAAQSDNAVTRDAFGTLHLNHAYSTVYNGEQWCDTHDSAYPCGGDAS